jgi:hypothetical protein
MLLLENLQPAPKPEPTPFGAPAVEFDGSEGIATTRGLPQGADFKEFLIEAGYDPEQYEVIGNPRTSRWQRYDGEWLTSYRFHFRLTQGGEDLKLLWSRANKYQAPKKETTQSTIVVLWSDTQTGKVGSRGNTTDLIERITAKQAELEKFLKKHKPEHAVFLNVGDSIEGFENVASQMFTNDLSLMEQVDLEATFQWEMLKMLAKYTGNVTAAAVGSNHCQWRKGKDKLGNPLDDWGIHIQRQLARLAQETNQPIKFYEPQPFDESLALPIYGEILGLAHGHQANRPEQIPNWWRGQSHGEQAVAEATILNTGHYHHLRITETGRKNGRSRWWVQAPTLDNGSDWYRLRSGDDSDAGLAVYLLYPDTPFSGTVYKL